jgi:hypothetical protein
MRDKDCQAPMYLTRNLALVATFAVGFSVLTSACGRSQPSDVSMISLISVPERFDGQRVRLHGYVHFELEGDGVYLNREDMEHHLYKNGLWVSLAKQISSDRCQDTYALIEGTFRSVDKGHMGLWSGAVTEVTRCERSP